MNATMALPALHVHEFYILVKSVTILCEGYLRIMQSVNNRTLRAKCRIWN